jgi:hypothetical protein
VGALALAKQRMPLEHSLSAVHVWLAVRARQRPEAHCMLPQQSVSLEHVPPEAAQHRVDPLEVLHDRPVQHCCPAVVVPEVQGFPAATHMGAAVAAGVGVVVARMHRRVAVPPLPRFWQVNPDWQLAPVAQQAWFVAPHVVVPPVFDGVVHEPAEHC